MDRFQQLYADSSSSDSEGITFDPAPPVADSSILATNEGAPARINANLPISKQNLHLAPKKESNIEEITMVDAIWQQKHYTKRIKKSKHHKGIRRDIPWDENEEKKPETPITDRMAYKQRTTNRTWFPAIGDTQLPDTVVWHNVINVKDYLGRSWVMQPISYVANPGHECFLPKANIHRFTYHTSSVTNVEMFPTFGHIMLSCSLDSTIKVWSLSGDRQCIQTYIGHTHGVRDCQFSRTGFRFASVCYGKRLKLWDTEKGFISGAILDSIPSQIMMNRSEDREDECIVALQDGRAVHYDFREGHHNSGDRKPIREYKFHSAPMSACAFLPGNKYFVTSGEDSALVMWEIGVDKPVAVLKDLWMKPISALVAHPTEPFICGQMQTGEIVVFKTSPSFSCYQKRSFTGHNPQSFPCRMTISPDGSFLASGDSDGKLYIWEWKSAILKKTFELHSQVLIKADWSPYNPSQILTASYDNSLCLLD
ncbi:pre-mRNA splicing factor [Tritrichomonas foetus]|uniref:Pre-mRNA splicing factor n=1 Tax=Tritrichomonas foetus TaxID=1144522 RepID=A0A1J4JG58_9EUKA|nr:pre-mRNA splicing factor [Tritrichomonas foetus]|eukprot:OHS96188.1 pre-mRNA splicing factor [Tritrichomonas foetus]